MVGCVSCAFALVACQPRQVDFTLRFGSPSTRSAAEAIRVSILENDCTGTPLFVTTFDPDVPGSAATPPLLSPGVYAFAAEARDGNCNVLARTCVVHELPLQSSVLELTLTDEPSPMPACPAAECTRGVCRDDTSPDAGPSPTRDGGTDTGVVGPNCTTDDECEGGRCRGGACCFGCWNGSACVPGTTGGACGRGGNDCAECGAGESCRANACVSGPPVTLSLAAETSYLRVGGALYSAGVNDYEQRGRLASTTPHVFSRQDTTIEFVDVAAVQQATCGIDTGGHLHCWGRALGGLLGNGTSGNYSEPEPVMVGIHRWTDVDGGDAHFCAIRMDGRLFCWGKNDKGQLGVGDGDRYVPTEVAAGGTWRAVSAGSEHTCGIRTDGTLHCWGAGDAGQLGVTGAVGGPTAVEVGGNDWVAVSAGVTHTCGIRGAAGSRALLCWGERAFGRIGDGNTDGVAETPALVDEHLDWIAVAAGTYHSCAITGTRAVYCWGTGSPWGRTGVEVADTNTPLLVISGFDLVAVSWDHSCAASIAGDELAELRCWGRGDKGQLGTGRTDHETTPAVPTLDPPP